MISWAYLFLGVALISAAFGFGIVSTSFMAQALTVIFTSLSVGAFYMQYREDRDR